MNQTVNLFNLIKSNRQFFIPFGVFIVIGAVQIIFVPQKEFFLIINTNHHEFLDRFFFVTTQIGDGLFFAAILLPLSLFRISFSLLSLLSYLSSGIAVQIVKRIVKAQRPKAVFGPEAIYLVEGVNVSSYNSFPSGHTASAFSLFLLLAIFTKFKNLGYLYFILALIVGLSRIYLSEHFFHDVYIGSILGVIFTLVVVLVIGNYWARKGPAWMHKPLLDLFGGESNSGRIEQQR